MTTTQHRPLDQDLATPPSSRPTGWFLPTANAVAWVTFIGIALAVQPAMDPAADVDPASVLVSTALWTTMLVGLFGLAVRERWGYLATVGGGFLLMLAAGTCFAGGHTGAWLIAQGLSGAGLAATGAVSWKVAG